mmetsp:Transcript_94691/g.230016  ORF Transcript_94691/g.230016 Transcript_94691/m.230016 type:complete len:232 (+) Transcript_94691:1389-2084(+)
MRGVCLTALHFTKAFLELLVQLLQDGNDTAGLELVSRHRWSTIRPLLQERRQRSAHARGLRGHLLEQHLRLWPVVALGRQDLDGLLQSIHGLGVVLLQLQVLGILRLPYSGSILLLRLHPGDVGVQVGDLVAQPRDLVLGLLDEGCQLLDAALARLDLEAEILRTVVRPLAVLGKGLPLGLHGGLRLGLHLAQGLEDRLHRRDPPPRGPGRRGGERQEHRKRGAAEDGHLH